MSPPTADPTLLPSHSRLDECVSSSKSIHITRGESFMYVHLYAHRLKVYYLHRACDEQCVQTLLTIAYRHDNGTEPLDLELPALVPIDGELIQCELWYLPDNIMQTTREAMAGGFTNCSSY
jgi:hypothetical protein